MFTNNLIDYYTTGKLGKCNNCGGNLELEEIKTPIRDNCIIKCPICGKSEYFTGTLNNT